VSEDNANPPHAVSPAASGPAGARFEGKVGAFYLLALLGSGEPRGLPGATARAVRFQQSAQDRPLDDVTIDAINADGTDAFLDIQAKRTIDFTRADANFADVVRRLWASSQMQQFATTRYEMAVAVARTSTRIERDCQQVLQWARQLGDGGSFAAHMQRAGFASNGMRGFVDAFRHHLTAAGAPTEMRRSGASCGAFRFSFLTLKRRDRTTIIARGNEAGRSSRRIRRAARPTCGRSSPMRRCRPTLQAEKCTVRRSCAISNKDTDCGLPIGPIFARCTRGFEKQRTTPSRT
jgi:hypothetical protein